MRTPTPSNKKQEFYLNQTGGADRDVSCGIFDKGKYLEANSVQVAWETTTLKNILFRSFFNKNS